MTTTQHITNAISEAAAIYGVAPETVSNHYYGRQYREVAASAKRYAACFIHRHTGYPHGVIAEMVGASRHNISEWLATEEANAKQFNSSKYNLP